MAQNSYSCQECYIILYYKIIYKRHISDRKKFVNVLTDWNTNLGRGLLFSLYKKLQTNGYHSIIN